MQKKVLTAAHTNTPTALPSVPPMTALQQPAGSFFQRMRAIFGGAKRTATATAQVTVSAFIDQEDLFEYHNPTLSLEAYRQAAE